MPNFLPKRLSGKYMAETLFKGSWKKLGPFEQSKVKQAMRQAMTFEGGKGLKPPSKVSFIAGKMSEILGDEFIAKMDQARSTGAKRKKEIEPSADKSQKQTARRGSLN